MESLGVLFRGLGVPAMVTPALPMQWNQFPFSFGFYIPACDEAGLANFNHYANLISH